MSGWLAGTVEKDGMSSVEGRERQGVNCLSATAGCVWSSFRLGFDCLHVAGSYRHRVSVVDSLALITRGLVILSLQSILMCLGRYYEDSKRTQSGGL